MKRVPFMISAGLLAVALTGCGGGAPASTPTPEPTVTAAAPSSTPTPTPNPAPVTIADVDAATYLLEGGPVEGQAWGARYGFFTDASRSVRCDFTVSSEAPGRVTCEVMKGFEKKISWTPPPPVGSPCTAAAGDRDGYELGAGLFQSIGVDVGFWGCRDVQSDHPDWVTATQVMPNGGRITVNDEYSCTVVSGVAECGRVGGPAQYRFGLSEATLLG